MFNCWLGNSFKNLEAIGGQCRYGRPALTRHKRGSLQVRGFSFLTLGQWEVSVSPGGHFAHPCALVT